MVSKRNRQTYIFTMCGCLWRNAAHVFMSRITPSAAASSALASIVVAILTLSNHALLHAQTTEFSTSGTTSITVSGTVIQDLSAQNIILDIEQEVNFVPENDNETVLVVDPVSDPVTFDPAFAGSGFAVAKGEPGARFTISFPSVIELTHAEEGSVLILEYFVAHSPTDDQQSAERVRQVSEEFVLNSEGEYYFWFGGRVDVSDAVDGEYDGDLFLEVEYTI